MLSLIYKYWNLDLMMTQIRAWKTILLLSNTFVPSELVFFFKIFETDANLFYRTSLFQIVAQLHSSRF